MPRRAATDFFVGAKHSAATLYVYNGTIRMLRPYDTTILAEPAPNQLVVREVWYDVFS